MIIISNGGVFYCAVCLVAHSFPNLGDPTDCGPPGSSGHGILQAGILEWVANPSSIRSSQPGINLPNPGLPHLPSEPPGKGILPGQILKLIRTTNSFLCLFHFFPFGIGMSITIIICLSYCCILEAGALLRSCFTDSQMQRNFALGF